MSSLCKKLCIPLLAIFILSCLFVPDRQTTSLSLAESDVTQSAASHLYDAYTDDDFFVWENETYTIQEYSSSLKEYTSIIGTNPGLANLFGASAIYTEEKEHAISYFSVEITGNDPIIEIVPKSLFMAEGQTLFIGREYGFFINTENDSRSNILHSTVLLFDITNQTNLPQTNDRLLFTVKVLFEMEYIYLPAYTESF